MRCPFLEILANELIRDAVENPMAHKMLFDFTLYIIIACHNWLLFEVCCLHVLAGGLRYLGANCSLNAGLGPRIVKADVTKRMPRLRILIVTEDVSCEVVKESVVVFLQFVKEIWVHRLLDLC